MLLIAAYQKREHKEWERSRFVAYTHYCSTLESNNRETIWEFLPLPTDPTPAQIEKIKAKAEREAFKKKQRRENELFKYYQSKGLLKID